MGQYKDEFEQGYEGQGKLTSANLAGREARRERDRLDKRFEDLMLASARPSPRTDSYPSSQSNDPATFNGTVKGFAFLGALFVPFFAYLEFNITGLDLVIRAVGGCIFGGIVGVAVYALIIVMRLLRQALGFVLKSAVWLGLAWLVYYIFSTQ